MVTSNHIIHPLANVNNCFCNLFIAGCAKIGIGDRLGGSESTNVIHNAENDNYKINDK